TFFPRKLLRLTSLSPIVFSVKSGAGSPTPGALSSLIASSFSHPPDSWAEVDRPWPGRIRGAAGRETTRPRRAHRHGRLPPARPQLASTRLQPPDVPSQIHRREDTASGL